jgi:predicted RND superfamily exporter protein
MHILVIFLVLGVGADNVFVCADKWRSTDGYESVEARVEETIDHTIRAVFNTSFTTIVAFGSTAISPIMPISAFGIFAATAIFVNCKWLLLLLLIVVVVACCCCFCCCPGL